MKFSLLFITMIMSASIVEHSFVIGSIVFIVLALLTYSEVVSMSEQS